MLKEAEIWPFDTQERPVPPCSTTHFWTNVSECAQECRSTCTIHFQSPAPRRVWFMTRQSSTRTPLGPGHQDRSSQARGRRCFAHGCRLRVGRVSGYLTGRSPPMSLSALAHNVTAILRTTIHLHKSPWRSSWISFIRTAPTMINSSSSTTPQLTSNRQIPGFLH